jgi:hypothetical protein
MLNQVKSSAKETLRWFTIKDAITRLFFLRDAQPAGFLMPFKGCMLANITGRGTRRDRIRLQVWRLPKQSGRFPGLFGGGLTCPGRTDACACSPLSRLALHNITLTKVSFTTKLFAST